MSTLFTDCFDWDAYARTRRAEAAPSNVVRVDFTRR